jgi:ubiquinone/menaquinone biosynthesis C-methylase UbiE
MAGEKDVVRDEWQAVARGWRRWEPLLQSFTWPMALRMAAVAEIGPRQRVLDVGCGIGDPTLQVAVLVGPHGRVVGVDVAEAMIATARERAAALGLGNVEFRTANVTTMELPAEGFDAVLGRWSLIYVDDVPGTLARLRRALVPTGHIALSGWAPPEENPWIAIPMQALARVRALPPPDPAAPGAFHLSADGALAKVLLQAGFQAVQQERVQLSWFAPDAAEFWAMTSDTAGPLAPLLADMSGAERQQVGREVATAIERFRAGDVLRIPAQAQLAWGRV